MNKVLLCIVLLVWFSPLSADSLKPFDSDGCSLFPDGSINNRKLWCECCLQHDIAYWKGGNKADKEQADKDLRNCVLKKTGNKMLAEIMYRGVQVGGHPIFPTWYRWAYGWQYLRGFKPISKSEHQLVSRQLAVQAASLTQYCR